jgi:hypothetical protein
MSDDNKSKITEFRCLCGGTINLLDHEDIDVRVWTCDSCDFEATETETDES